MAMAWTHVVHLADVHLRTGNVVGCRDQEYRSVFDALRADILQRCADAVANGTLLVVVSGDIFHNKSKLESTTVRLWNAFVDTLTALGSVFVICGNHDFRQEDPDMPDLIEGLIENDKHHAITYLNQTGVHITRDVALGVVSIKDTLNPFSTRGAVDELPAFPKVERTPAVRRALALFHGTVHESAVATLDGSSGTNFIGAYPLSWIEAGGYDAALLGDNHKQQVGATASGMAWGYPGSLVQQDVGEPLYGHGYLLWDLHDMTATPVHVYNRYGRVKAAVRDGKLLLQVAPKLWREAADAVPAETFPENPVVCVCGAVGDDVVARDVLAAAGKVPSRIERTTQLKAPTQKGTSANNAGPDDDGGVPLFDLTNAEHWMTFLRTTAPDLATSVQRHRWLDDPSTLAPPLDGMDALPKDVQARLLSGRDKVEEALRVYQSQIAAAAAATAPSGSVRLRHLQWAWAFAYGENNWFDFDALRGNVALLNGPNASGKSSFIDVVCIALYGEPGRDRLPFSRLRKMSARFMHAMRPKRQDLVTRLLMDVGGKTYELARKYVLHQSKGVDDAVNLQAELYAVDLDGGGTKTLVAQDNSVTQWVEQHCGSVEAAQRTAIVAQADTHHFFTLKPPDQIKLLDEAVNLKALQLYADAVKAARTAHDTLITGLAAAVSALDDDGGGGGSSSAADCEGSGGANGDGGEEADAAAASVDDTEWTKRTQQVQTLQATIERLAHERDEFAASCGTAFMRAPPVDDARRCDERVQELYAALDGARLKLCHTTNLHDLRARRAVLLHEREKATGELHGADAAAQPSVAEAAKLLDAALAAVRRREKIDDDYAGAVAELKEQEEELASRVALRQACDEALATWREKQSRYADTKKWWSADALQERISDTRDRRGLRARLQQQLDDLNRARHELLSSLPYNADCQACMARKGVLQDGTETLLRQLADIPDEAALVAKEQQWQARLQQYSAFQSYGEELQQNRQASDEEARQWRRHRLAAKKGVDELARELAALDAKEVGALKVADAEDAVVRARAARRLSEIGPELAAVEAEVERCEAVRALQQEYAAAVAANAWHLHAATVARLRQAAEELEGAQKLVAVAEAARARCTTARTLRERLDEWKRRRDLLEELYARLVDVKHTYGPTFKDWVYTERIVGLLEARVNEFLEGLDALRIRVAYSASGNNNNLTFYVLDRGSETLLSAASGYQQFMLNLAMRRALATLGNTGHVLRHMIIDEGFTACDATNLEKVGRVLRQLLEGLDLSSILIVTHLDAVKDAVPLRINVRRDGAFSMLCYGRPYPTLQNTAAAANGAPSSRRRKVGKEFM